MKIRVYKYTVFLAIRLLFSDIAVDIIPLRNCIYVNYQLLTFRLESHHFSLFLQPEASKLGYSFI